MSRGAPPAFWFWMTGFLLAFMPLYVLGLHGHARAAWSSTNDPSWQPWLIAASMGPAVLILIGIGCLVMQLVASIRDRKLGADVTGDPL